MLHVFLLFVSAFLFSCGDDDSNGGTSAAGEAVEFTIDGTSYTMSLSIEEATSLRAGNFGGFGTVTASGLLSNAPGSTMELNFGFEGAEPGTYNLSGNAQGTNEGLRITFRSVGSSGASRPGDWEAASVTLNVTRFDLSGDNPDVEATFSGTLTDLTNQQTVSLTNGRIRILP